MHCGDQGCTGQPFFASGRERAEGGAEENFFGVRRGRACIPGGDDGNDQCSLQW